MTAAQVAGKLLASEHADVRRQRVAWMVAELLEAEVAAQLGWPRATLPAAGVEDAGGGAGAAHPQAGSGSYLPLFLEPRRRREVIGLDLGAAETQGRSGRSCCGAWAPAALPACACGSVTPTTVSGRRSRRCWAVPGSAARGTSCATCSAMSPRPAADDRRHRGELPGRQPGPGRPAAGRGGRPAQPVAPKVAGLPEAAQPSWRPSPSCPGSAGPSCARSSLRPEPPTTILNHTTSCNLTHHGEAGPTHCPEPVAGRGSWRAPDGRRYRVDACKGHRPPPVEGGGPAV